MRAVGLFIKFILEVAVIFTWIAFAVGVSINDPPLKSIAFTFGLLALVTTIIVAFTRRFRR